MQKIMFFGVAVFLLLLIVSAGCVSDTPPADEVKTYVVGIDRYYPPFSYINAESNPVGFDVESAKWIAEQKDFNVEFKSFAWNELIPALQNGEIDMIYTGLIITPERDEVIDFTIPYWEVDLGVAAQEDSNISLDDVYQGRAIIGYVKGTTTEGWLKENIDSFDQNVAEGLIVGYNSFALSVVGLQNNGCDAVIFDDIGMEHLIQGKPVKIIGIIDTEDKYAIGVKEGNDELRELLNEGLTELMQSPKWQELIDRYINTDENI